MRELAVRQEGEERSMEERTSSWTESYYSGGFRFLLLLFSFVILSRGMILPTYQRTTKSRWPTVIKAIELSRINTIAQFRALLKKVQEESDQFLLEQEGKVIAALVPPDHVEAMAQQDIVASTREVRAEDSARSAFFSVMDKVQARNLEFSEEEVEQDIMAAREEVRRSHA